MKDRDRGIYPCAFKKDKPISEKHTNKSKWLVNNMKTLKGRAFMSYEMAKCKITVVKKVLNQDHADQILADEDKPNLNYATC